MVVRSPVTDRFGAISMLVSMPTLHAGIRSVRSASFTWPATCDSGTTIDA
jgi:hypothetical protein